MPNIDTTDFIEVAVPPTFWWDHADRDLVQFSGEPTDYVVRRTKARVTVLLHEDDLFDLVSDAYHYATETEYDLIGLTSSARATLLALHDQGVIERLVREDSGLYRHVQRLVLNRELAARRREIRKAHKALAA